MTRNIESVSSPKLTGVVGDITCSGTLQQFKTDITQRGGRILWEEKLPYGILSREDVEQTGVGYHLTYTPQPHKKYAIVSVTTERGSKDGVGSLMDDFLAVTGSKEVEASDDAKLLFEHGLREWAIQANLIEPKDPSQN